MTSESARALEDVSVLFPASRWEKTELQYHRLLAQGVDLLWLSTSALPSSVWGLQKLPGERSHHHGVESREMEEGLPTQAADALMIGRTVQSFSHTDKLAAS